jgi:hypothetical protein
MARKFSVSYHTTFFAGYLDAVGRHYSDDEWLCAISVFALPAESPERLEIVSAKPVKNMVREFERDIAKFLDSDPKNRLVFYLTEYFDWYKGFSGTCVCEKVQVKGRDIPPDSLAYRLLVDQQHEVLFLAYWKEKEAMPNKSPERTGEG